VELISAMRSPQEDFVDASIRQFCATGNARLRTCTDFDTKRQFLIFNGYRIAAQVYEKVVAVIHHVNHERFHLFVTDPICRA
jgi:hypothetical protein